MMVTDTPAGPRLSFAGAYWALLIPGYTLVLTTVIALGQYSRSVTIGHRLLIVGVVAWILVGLGRHNRHWGWPLLLGIFYVAYSARVFIEGRADRLGKAQEDYLLLLWGGVFLPAVAAYVLGRRGRPGRHDVLCFLVVGACFALVAWRAWGFLLADSMSVRVRGMRGQEQTINPLSLSYLGTAGLLVGIWVAARVSGWTRKLAALGVGFVSMIPIYLGSSRGALVAAVVVGAAYVIRSLSLGKHRRNALRSGAVLLVFLLAVVFVMVRTGSGAVNRLANLGSDYETGASSVSRLELYEYALARFIEAPLFGSALEVTPGTYPHNVILEALMSCGLFGVIYIALLITGAWRAFLDLHDPLVGWLAVLLLIYLSSNMFSGAIWGADSTTCLAMYFLGRRGRLVEAKWAHPSSVPSAALRGRRFGVPRPAAGVLAGLSQHAVRLTGPR